MELKDFTAGQRIEFTVQYGTFTGTISKITKKRLIVNQLAICTGPYIITGTSLPMQVNPIKVIRIIG